MDSPRDMLDWIDAQRPRMVRLVTELAEINSGTTNLKGLALVSQRLAEELAALGAPVENIELPPRTGIDLQGNPVASPLAPALRAIKPGDGLRIDARRVFLGIHFDTVYDSDHPFQRCTAIDDNTLRGPGVADAKGGIVVMLTALAAIERSAWRDRIRWEVLLNPDEEIGSPGSASLLREAAARNEAGLVFEPALEGGFFAGARRGSGNFTVVIRGRAAHVGRNPRDGRSAIHAAAQLIHTLAQRAAAIDGITFNAGKIDGGGPANVVADLAIVRLNLRVDSPAAQREAMALLADGVAALRGTDGITGELHGGITSPPKPLDDRFLSLLEMARECGNMLNLDLHWRPTGGVCDGNKLAAAGLPNIDSLGPRGGSIHSDREYLLLDSLTERAKLTALLLTRLAAH